jgi:Fe2+ transport system protein FeoA
LILLSDLKIDQKAKILNIKSQFLSKLLAMGLIPDAEIKLIRFAPGGDPIEFEIKGYLLSLRKSICQGVEVDLIE